MKLIIYILLCFLCLSFVYLIYHIVKYIKYITNRVVFDLTVEKNKEQNLNHIDLDTRIDTTDKLLKMITILVDTEIQKKINLLSLKKEEYKILNLDKDIKNINTLVYRSINPNVFNDPELILIDEFIISFISSQTMLRFTTAVREYNLKLTTEEFRDENE